MNEPSGKNLQILKINILTQEQYNTALEEDNINNNEFYLTPDTNDVTVDKELSDTSENPVQNQAITKALKDKQATLDFDSEPTPNSSNPVTSGGIYAALDNVIYMSTDNEVIIDAKPMVDITEVVF